MPLEDQMPLVYFIRSLRWIEQALREKSDKKHFAIMRNIVYNEARPIRANFELYMKSSVK